MGSHDDETMRNNDGTFGPLRDSDARMRGNGKCA